VTSLQTFDEQSFDILKKLFEACATQRKLIDHNIARIAQVFSLFSVELSALEVIPVFDAIFLDCSALEDSQILPAALQFWELGLRFPSKLNDLVRCPSFFPVFRSLFSCDGESATAMATDLAEAAALQLESQVQLRSSLVGFLSTHEITFHFAALSPLFPPLLCLLPDEFPTVIARFGFRVIANQGLSDRSLFDALSLILSAADALSAVSVEALAIDFCAIAAAAAASRAGVADAFHDFVRIWADDDGFSGSLLRELWRIDSADAARAGLRLELCRTGADIAAIVRAVRKSKAAVAALAEIIPDNAAVSEFLRENVGAMLKEETVLTDSTEQFYRLGLSFVDGTELINLYLELLPEADGESGRTGLAKAVLVAAARPDYRETFLEVPPFGDVGWLDREGLWH
jgi:hypothetical protein